MDQMTDNSDSRRQAMEWTLRYGVGRDWKEETQWE